MKKFFKLIFKPIDLTQGNALKVILLFALPILLATLLQNGFSLINSLVLKQTVGGNSVTAINQTGPITNILFMFAYGCGGGFAVIVANRYGAKDQKGLAKTFYNSMYLSVLLSIIITIIGLSCYKQFLNLLGTSSTFFDKACNYFVVIIISFVFMMLNNTLAGYLRALGNSSVPLLVSLITTIINVAFAYLLTGAIKLDTTGVALATLIANLVSVVIYFVYLFKKYPFLKYNKDIGKLDKSILLDLTKIGLPLGFQWSVLFIGSFIQTSTINSFGDNAQKAISCYSQIESYLTIPLSVTATAFLSFVGINYGAHNMDRIRKGFKSVILLDFCFYGLLVLTGELMATSVAYIFLPIQEVNDDIIFYSSKYLQIVMPFLIFQGLLQLSRSTLQGMKKPLIPFASGIGELAARAMVCYLLPLLVDPANPTSHSNYLAICFSTPFAWIISFIIMGGSAYYFLFYKPRHTNALTKETFTRVFNEELSQIDTKK